MVKRPKSYLIICHDMIQSGGLLRFTRFGKEIKEKFGHTLTFAYINQSPKLILNTDFEVISFEDALSRNWDVTMIPGAGFPIPTINKLSDAIKENFGLRVQHILNSPNNEKLRDKFVQVNNNFKPDIVIFNNQHWEVGKFTDLMAKKFVFLEGGVDVEHFSLNPNRHYKKADKLIKIGGLINKNVNILIDSLKFLPDNFELNLIGTSKNLSINDLDSNLQNRIKVLGWHSNEELPSFFNEIDCVVHPVLFAGWANICAEGLASGIPIICTRFGSEAFAFNDETAILLSDDPKPREIADKLLNLFSTENKAEKIAKQGREIIESFSWKKYSIELDNLCVDDGKFHYTFAPSLGLFGKWPLSYRFQGLEPLFSNVEGKYIIDFGAAEGVISLEAYKNGAKVVHGFDIEQDRMKTAAELCKKYPSSIFRQSDISDWNTFINVNSDIIQKEYDIVLFLGIYHHIPKQNCKSVLNGALKLTGDLFVIRTPEKLFIEDKLNKIILKAGFSEIKLSKEYQASGLGIVKYYKKTRSKKKLKRNRDLMKKQFVSYPKSGRSWIRYALIELGIENQIEFHHDGFEFNDGTLPPHQFSKRLRIKKYKNSGKTIYLEREPKDIMVSLYHQITGRFNRYFNYAGSISDFIRDDYFGAQNLQNFRKIWNDLCKKNIALKITYENLHTSFESEFLKLLDYYDFEFSDEIIIKAKNLSSFDNMKKIELSNSSQLPWLQTKDGFPKVRKGEVGGYINELNNDDIKYLNKIFKL